MNKNKELIKKYEIIDYHSQIKQKLDQLNIEIEQSKY